MPTQLTTVNHYQYYNYGIYMDKVGLVMFAESAQSYSKDSVVFGKLQKHHDRHMQTYYLPWA